MSTDQFSAAERSMTQHRPGRRMAADHVSAEIIFILPSVNHAAPDD